jgi:hypothetical protein
MARVELLCRYWMSSHCRSLYNGLCAGLQRQMCFASVRLGLYDSVKTVYQPLIDGTPQLWPVTLSCALHMSLVANCIMCRKCLQAKIAWTWPWPHPSAAFLFVTDMVLPFSSIYCVYSPNVLHFKLTDICVKPLLNFLYVQLSFDIKQLENNWIDIKFYSSTFNKIC